MAQWPSSVDASFALGVLFEAQVAVDVVIDVPSEAASVVTQQVDVQWSWSPGTQSSYRVRFWSDAAATVLVHDTGVVGGASSAVIFDAALIGLNSGSTYYITVDLTFTNGGTGVSGVRSFSLSAAAINTVTATATPNIATLPYMDIDWTAYTLGGGETFLNYNVWRRVAGETVWTRLAGPTLTNRTGDITYADYTAAPFVTYEYTVTARVSVATGEDESAKDGTPPSDSLDFIPGYIHDFASKASNYATLLITQARRSEDQDQRLHQPWGRQEPTVLVGDAQPRTITLTLARQRSDSNFTMFTDTVDLLDRQRENATTMVLRFRRETYFGVIRQVQRNDQAGKLYSATVTFQPVYFDEAV